MNLTDAEWSVMECLWEDSPRTGREATEYMEEKMGWNRSTTLTLLRRLETKGAVESGTQDGLKVFLPLVRREDAAAQETRDLLSRVYSGSISLMVSSLTKKEALSREEIDELYSILRKMEGKSDD